MSALGKSASSAVVGLDIGSEFIKVAEAKKAKDGIRITGLGIAPTPEGAVDNNVVVDPQALAAAVKEILRENGIKTKTVVSSVSGQSSVVVRVIEVPMMTESELNETMKWEVERHVPFSPDEIVMDFARIEKPDAPPDAQSMEVLLAVAQEDAINEHVKTLLAAGLRPIAIDVQPLAMSRGIVDIDPDAVPPIVGIVNIGANTTDVGIFESGTLAFPGPPLPIAGVNITRAISEALGVSIEEAEKLKIDYAEAEIAPMLPEHEDTTSQDAAASDSEAFDTGSQSAETQSEPTSFDTSFQQPASDFSPFDFGATAPSDPEPEPEQQNAPLDISGEDVFDLGGGQEPSTFKPIFDLGDADDAPVQDESSSDLDGAAAESEGSQTNAISFDDESSIVPEVAESLDTRRRVIEAIMPVLAELATEIRRSIEYYASRYQNQPEVIYLCGGTAKLHNLDKYLAHELGLQVQIADPISNFNVNIPKYSDEYRRELSPIFPVSIGLAIRELLE